MKALNNLDISYVPRDGVTPENEVDALANVYKVILDSKKAARTGRPDDAKEINNACAKISIP